MYKYVHNTVMVTYPNIFQFIFEHLDGISKVMILDLDAHQVRSFVT